MAWSSVDRSLPQVSRSAIRYLVHRSFYRCADWLCNSRLSASGRPTLIRAIDDDETLFALRRNEVCLYIEEATATITNVTSIQASNRQKQHTTAPKTSTNTWKHAAHYTRDRLYHAYDRISATPITLPTTSRPSTATHLT